MKYPQASWCAECGPVKVDVDGCCSACGGNAMGEWADVANALWMEKRSPVARAERAVVKAVLTRRTCSEKDNPSPRCVCDSVMEQATDRLLAARKKARR